MAAMTRESRLQLFVTTVALAAMATGAMVFSARLPFPGWWPIATFLFFATLLETLQTQLRLAARGSTSFIMHMASALLFGGWWGAMVAGGSTLFGEIARGSPPIKLIFNTSQRVLAVSLAAMAYHVLGGELPPAYLSSLASLASQAVQRDLGLFLIFAMTYFVINSAAVNTAIVLSSGRAFREVWNLNTRGLLAYDLTARFVGVLVAWL
jgi:hypothetical protein